MRTPRFARHARLPFERWIKPRFAGKPIHYLELGVFQGASAKWMFDNVLTHPDSFAELVDPWLPYMADAKHDYSEDAMEKAAKSVHEFAMAQGRVEGQSDGFLRCWVFRKTSAEYLAQCPRHRFDIAYHDGAHDAETVLKDAIGLLPLIKPAGWIVFDDCNEAGVRKAVNAFADVFSERLKLVYATKQQKCYEAC